MLTAETTITGISDCIVMVESHLCAGAQKFTPGKDNPNELKYATSITDACIGWDDSLNVLEILAEGVRQRRKKK